MTKEVRSKEKVRIKIKGLTFEFNPGTSVDIEDDYMYAYADAPAEERGEITATDWEYRIDLRTAEGWERHSGTTKGCIWADWEHMLINKFNTIVI